MDSAQKFSSLNGVHAAGKFFLLVVSSLLPGRYD
jgi:hypothetical protein